LAFHFVVNVKICIKNNLFIIFLDFLVYFLQYYYSFLYKDNYYIMEHKTYSYKKMSHFRDILTKSQNEANNMLPYTNKQFNYH